MRVLVFGDSIAQGFWDVDGGWVSRIRRHYDKQMIERLYDDPPTIFNLGVSGDCSDDVLARFENETTVRAREELVFVIAVGTNDSRTKAGQNFSNTSRYIQNIEKIIDLAKRHSSKILVVGLTPCVEERSNLVVWGDSGYTNQRVKEFDDTLMRFCKDNGISFVKIYEPFAVAQAQAELLPDGLHPNDAGHQLIADLVLPMLDELLS
jgi:lysophospholipase L1-like esterase